MKQIFDSNTNREVHDFYPTPSPVTEALLHCGIQFPKHIFEPCAGNGAISDVLRQRGHIVAESDIQWNMQGKPKDASSKDFWLHWGDYYRNVDYAVVTNPPFSLAEQILPMALKCSTWGVAFLLRLSYQEATKGRSDWLQENSDQLIKQITINPRVKFRTDKKGTDSITCAWFIWKKDWSWRQRGIPCPFDYLAKWR